MIFGTFKKKLKHFLEFQILMISCQLPPLLNAQSPITILCAICANLLNRMPFDVSTFSMGYITAYVIQLSGSAVICAIIYTINSLFFGICLYIGVLLRDLHQTYHHIDKLYTTNSGWAAYKCNGAEHSSNFSNNNKAKTLQLNDRAIGSFGGRIELGRINQATTLIKKFVEDHNDILR